MDSPASTKTIDLDTRLARSVGRAGRDRMANARVTTSELEELQAAAQRSGMALSEWSREVLMREARRPTDDPLMTEVTAIRMALMLLLKPLLLNQTVTPEWIAEQLNTVRRDKRKVTKEVMQQYREPATGGQ